MRGFFPKCTKGINGRNLPTSRVLYSFTGTGGPLPWCKILLFLRCEECQKRIEKLGPKKWKLSSRKLSQHLINGAEIEGCGA